MAELDSSVKRILGTELFNDNEVDEVSRNRVLRFFYNCLYLGQWHLAASCLAVQRQENANSLCIEESIELVLKELVEHPYCSRSVLVFG